MLFSKKTAFKTRDTDVVMFNMSVILLIAVGILIAVGRKETQELMNTSTTVTNLLRFALLDPAKVEQKSKQTELDETLASSIIAVLLTMPCCIENEITIFGQMLGSVGITSYLMLNRSATQRQSKLARLDPLVSLCRSSRLLPKRCWNLLTCFRIILLIRFVLLLRRGSGVIYFVKVSSS
jgi:hypothetical protein